MDDKFDEIMTEYFHEKKKPSYDVKTNIHGKLIVAERKKVRKQLWLATLGIIGFSIVLLCITCTIAGSVIAICTAFANLIVSLTSSILLILISKKENMGGNEDAILY